MSTIKVRDRATNKTKDVMVDAEDFDRLKNYKYITDNNSKGPFREQVAEGKRQRISLKRDVMQLAMRDTRRVFYVDKSNPLDCRKSNLSISQADEPAEKPVANQKETNLDVKKSLAAEVGEDRVLALVSIDDLLGLWAETHGYKKGA